MLNNVNRITSAVCLSFLLISSFVIPHILRAQTRFIPVEERKDLNDYDFIEKCLVAIKDIDRQEIVRRGVIQDTIEFEYSERVVPLSDVVVKFAKECSSRWKSMPSPALRKDTIYYDIAKLFLYANRDDEVRKAYRKLIDERSQADDSVFVWSWGAMFVNTIFTKPIRFEILDLLADEIIERRNKVSGVDKILNGYALNLKQLLNQYMAGGKFDRATLMATKIVQLNDNLSEVDKDQIGWAKNGGAIITFGALNFLNHSKLLDSLRQSTSAYFNLRNSLIDHATGKQRQTMRSLIGTIEPDLSYDFYFKASYGTGAGITAGGRAPAKLVLFLGHHCYQDVPKWRSGPQGPRQCHDTYATIRRIKEEFKDVQIVIAAQTRGFFGSLTPPSPAEEAQKLKELWLDFHRLPADLVVENTPHWFLPGYDRRRIDEHTENFKKYSLDNTLKLGLEQVFLMDSDGVIIHSDVLSRFGALQIKDMLRVLRDREASAQ